jgi:hypothetical protein
MVTFFADIESGDSYLQMVPPAVDAGPESGSFNFSPITCSASALVTSLHASSSVEAGAAAKFWLHTVRLIKNKNAARRK